MNRFSVFILLLLVGSEFSHASVQKTIFSADVVASKQTPGKLQAMFGSEGPLWLQDIGINETIGLSSFSDAALHQIEGVYGAQVVPGSGELRLADKTSSRWRVSLPVSIEYQ